MTKHTSRNTTSSTTARKTAKSNRRTVAPKRKAAVRKTTPKATVRKTMKYPFWVWDKKAKDSATISRFATKKQAQAWLERAHPKNLRSFLIRNGRYSKVL